MKKVDVLVVGAGPAGTTTALLLAERGFEVLLVDRARFPRDKICGDFASPETWRVFDRIGATAAVEALLPRRIRGMMLSSPGGTCFRGLYAANGSFRPTREFGLALPRRELDSALLAHARRRGVPVEEGVRCEGLLINNDARVAGALLSNGVDAPREVPARVVVGADGRKSVVARELGLRISFPRFQKFALRAYFDGVSGLGECGEMHIGDPGYCGVAPVGEGRANVCVVVDRRDLRGHRGSIEVFYRSWLERHPDLGPRLRTAEQAGPVSAIGPLAVGARRASTSGALLVGDAAGFYDPFTGEGFYRALRSAELAAEAIEEHLRSGFPLEAYETRRRREFAAKERIARALQGLVARPVLADWVARRLATREWLAHLFVGVAGDVVPPQEVLSPRFIARLLTT